MYSIKKHVKNKTQNKISEMVMTTSVVTINLISKLNGLAKAPQTGLHTTPRHPACTTACRANF